MLSKSNRRNATIYICNLQIVVMGTLTAKGAAVKQNWKVITLVDALVMPAP